MTEKAQRNWSQYNRTLKKHASIELYIREDIDENWCYRGPQKRGGKKIYPDHIIEMCLVIREYYKLPLRQCEGFLVSLFARLGTNVKIPDYTTLSRRCQTLSIDFKPIHHRKKDRPLRIAIDSTGLSLLSQTQWHTQKHGASPKKTSQDKWRKLHIIMDVDTGDILNAAYTQTNCNDCTMVQPLLAPMTTPIEAVYGDLAYDTFPVRDIIRKKGAKQVIPVKKTAVHSTNLTKKKKYPPETYATRDHIIRFLEHNKINGCDALAMKLWKQKVGYHKRSLVETQMSRIKAHTTDKLSSKREDNRKVQALIKVKIVNLLNTI